MAGVVQRHEIDKVAKSSASRIDLTNVQSITQPEQQTRQQVAEWADFSLSSGCDGLFRPCAANVRKNMCCLFRSQDPTTYAAETRAIRLHGHATSIRLEAAFWDILDEIALKEEMSVARFICVLHDEILAQQDQIANLASFLRVTCLHYLGNKELHAQQVAQRLGRTKNMAEKIIVVA